jgi:hypothetical protein
MCHGGFLPPFQDNKDKDGKQQQQPQFMPRDELDGTNEYGSKNGATKNDGLDDASNKQKQQTNTETNTETTRMT